MVMFVQRSPWRALNALLIEWPSIGRVAAVPHEGRGVMIAALDPDLDPVKREIITSIEV